MMYELIKTIGIYSIHRAGNAYHVHDDEDGGELMLSTSGISNQGIKELVMHECKWPNLMDLSMVIAELDRLVKEYKPENSIRFRDMY